MYLPQTPYMPIGTLEECIIYPHINVNQGAGRARVAEVVKLADLDKVVKREGLYSPKQWDDILSGGESQKVAMARIYYHRPTFAILDEATSMVSASLEPRLYKQLQGMGVTTISIAHRVAVWPFHTHVLHYTPAPSPKSGFIATLKKLTPEVRRELVKGYDIDVKANKKPFSRPAGKREGLKRRALSVQDLKAVPRHVLRGAYIGGDWRKLLKRDPEAPSDLLTPTSSMLNIAGTAASMLDVDQRGD
ncbi:hypothetical protein AAMO2058_001298100 [Amorphochlora amoebiformis]